MKIHAATLALITLPLVACDDTTATPVMRSGSAQAEAACVNLVNRNFGRDVATVTSSEFSQANTVVMLSAEGQTFRCLTSESGEVFELLGQG